MNKKKWFAIFLLFLGMACMGQTNPVKPIIFVAASPGADPFLVEDPGTTPGWKGFYVELLEQIFTKELGIKYTVETYPWARAQTRVESGEADCMIAVATQARLGYALKSDDPVERRYLFAYTYKGHPKLDAIRAIKTAADIKTFGLSPATNIGNDWQKENIDAFGVTTIYVPAEENLVQFLALKRADLMIEAAITINPVIRKFGLQDQLVQTDAKFGPLEFNLLVSRKSSYAALMPRINRAIRKLALNGTLDKIAEKYRKLN